MTEDVDDFDRVVAQLDPAMIVVTAATGRERAGCLVGFHSQSSIEPRHYCVWVSKANHTYEVVRRTGAFAIHMLGADDRATAALFGSESVDASIEEGTLTPLRLSGVADLEPGHRPEG